MALGLLIYQVFPLPFFGFILCEGVGSAGSIQPFQNSFSVHPVALVLFPYVQSYPASSFTYVFSELYIFHCIWSYLIWHVVKRPDSASWKIWFFKSHCNTYLWSWASYLISNSVSFMRKKVTIVPRHRTVLKI